MGSGYKMAFYVYDHGYRIQTPKESIFPPRGVGATQQTRHSHRSADKEDKVHADGEKFVIPSRNQNASGKTPSHAGYTSIHEQLDNKDSDDKSRLTLSHIMVSPVHSVTPYALIRAAWQRMEELKIGHLVVLDDAGQLKGLISKHDLLEAGKDSLGSINEIYTRQLIAATPETTVRDAASSFIEHNINSLPVIDKKGKVVGIVCRTDLLRLLVSQPNQERWV